MSKQAENSMSAATDKGVLAAYVPADQLTTPTRYAANKRELRAMRVEMRAALAQIRTLRASPRFLDREDAESEAVAFHAYLWLRYRALQTWLREMVPVKNSHISPRAAERALARCGGAQ